MVVVEKFNVAWISLTYNCNNRCNWCYALSNLNENHKKTLKKEHEKPIVKLLSLLDIKRVILIGGEPTIYSNLSKIVEKLTDKGIVTGMVSNGRKLRDISLEDPSYLEWITRSDFSIEVKEIAIKAINGEFPEASEPLQTVDGEIQ